MPECSERANRDIYQETVIFDCANLRIWRKLLYYDKLPLTAAKTNEAYFDRATAECLGLCEIRRRYRPRLLSGNAEKIVHRERSSSFSGNLETHPALA